MIHSVTFPTNKQLDLWKLQAQHRKYAKIPAKIALRALRAVTPPQSSRVTNDAKLFLPGVDGRSATARTYPGAILTEKSVADRHRSVNPPYQGGDVHADDGAP
jgi:hypothetical protein